MLVAGTPLVAQTVEHTAAHLGTVRNNPVVTVDNNAMARPQYQEIHLKAADVNRYYSAASAPKFEGPVNGEYELVLGEKEGRPVLYDGRQQVILPYVEPEVQRPTCTVQLVNVNPEEPKRCRCLKWILLALAVVAIVSITVHFLRPKIDRPRYRI